MEYDFYSQLDTFTTKLTMNTISFLMKNGDLKKYAAGDVVFSEGDDSKCVYIVIDGKADVFKRDHFKNRIHIATVGNGALIGEMGVFLDMHRSATVRAKTPLTLVEFTNENFVNALPKTPDLTLRLLKSLADKINLANQKYTKLMLKNGMLVVGLYILSAVDAGLGECEVSLDAKMLISETKLEHSKIKTVLSLFRKNDLIDKVHSDDEKHLVFNVRPRELKAFLKGMST
jgi:CRP-like cAMP-binding protein